MKKIMLFLFSLLLIPVINVKAYEVVKMGSSDYTIPNDYRYVVLNDTKVPGYNLEIDTSGSGPWTGTVTHLGRLKDGTYVNGSFTIVDEVVYNRASTYDEDEQRARISPYRSSYSFADPNTAEAGITKRTVTWKFYDDNGKTISVKGAFVVSDIDNPTAATGFRVPYGEVFAPEEGIETILLWNNTELFRSDRGIECNINTTGDQNPARYTDAWKKQALQVLFSGNTLSYSMYSSAGYMTAISAITALTETYKVLTWVKNGTIDDSVYNIPSGDDITIKYKPNDGYKLDKIIVNDKEVDITKYPDEYTFSNITSNQKIEVIYVPVYKITTEVVNGTIDDDIYDIEENENHTINYKPNDGYVLVSITVDGKEVSLEEFKDKYDFNNINSNHHIKVVYEKEGEITTKQVKGETEKVVNPKTGVKSLITLLIPLLFAIISLVVVNKKKAL